jgi:hypothetical protein
MIANDVTVQSGSFGVLEDDFFFKASVYARERGAWNTKNPTDNLHHITPPDPFHRLNIAILVTITASLLPLYPSTLTHSVSSSCLFEYDAYIGIPRVFISCNSGARIGLVDELKPKFRVSDDFHEMIRMSILLHLITSLDTRIVWTLPLSFCPAPLTLPSFPSPSFLPSLSLHTFPHPLLLHLQVAWKEESNPSLGFDYLYLSEEDYHALPKGTVDAVAVLDMRSGETRWQLEAIIGQTHGIGVENLRYGASSSLLGNTLNSLYSCSFWNTLSIKYCSHFIILILSSPCFTSICSILHIPCHIFHHYS